jgi:hypothetical protein
MGARLALGAATITTPAGDVLKARTVQGLGAIMRIINRGTIEVERGDLDRADRTGPRTWRLVMANGDAYTVERGKGCGCHGGR